MDPLTRFSEATTALRKASERIRAIFGNLRKGKKKRGEGWVGEGKNQGGVGGEGQKKVRRVGDDVIEKIKKLKLKN